MSDAISIEAQEHFADWLNSEEELVVMTVLMAYDGEHGFSFAIEKPGAAMAISATMIGKGTSFSVALDPPTGRWWVELNNAWRQFSSIAAIDALNKRIRPRMEKTIRDGADG